MSEKKNTPLSVASTAVAAAVVILIVFVVMKFVFVKDSCDYFELILGEKQLCSDVKFTMSSFYFILYNL